MRTQKLKVEDQFFFIKVTQSLVNSVIQLKIIIVKPVFSSEIKCLRLLLNLLLTLMSKGLE